MNFMINLFQHKIVDTIKNALIALFWFISGCFGFFIMFGFATDYEKSSWFMAFIGWGYITIDFVIICSKKIIDIIEKV